MSTVRRFLPSVIQDITSGNMLAKREERRSSAVKPRLLVTKQGCIKFIFDHGITSFSAFFLSSSKRNRCTSKEIDDDSKFCEIVMIMTETIRH